MQCTLGFPTPFPRKYAQTNSTVLRANELADDQDDQSSFRVGPLKGKTKSVMKPS